MPKTFGKDLAEFGGVLKVKVIKITNFCDQAVFAVMLRCAGSWKANTANVNAGIVNVHADVVPLVPEAFTVLTRDMPCLQVETQCMMRISPSTSRSHPTHRPVKPTDQITASLAQLVLKRQPLAFDLAVPASSGTDIGHTATGG
eukprot:259506-Rhodomonas_salina.2